MAATTTIQGSDVIKNSRAVLNANFAALNTAKVEGAAALTTAGAIPYVSAAGVVTSDPTKLRIDPVTGTVSILANAAGLNIQSSTSTDGAVLDLYHKQVSPAPARIGEFHFYSDNAAGTKTQMAALYAESASVTAGAESSRLLMNFTRAGAIFPFFQADAANGVVEFNQGFGTPSNLNFRVQAVGQTDAFFVQGSSGRVGVRTRFPSAPFTVLGGSGNQQGNAVAHFYATDGQGVYVGYNIASKYGYIGAVTDGASHDPLILQPSGSNVRIGSGADDGVNRLQVNGSATATSFVGPLVGNAATATALAGALPSGRLLFGDGTGVPATDAGLSWNSASKLLAINSPTGAGGTGSENLYKLRINMGSAPGYGLSIANGAIDPWFHVNSNGIGFIGDGTTIPFWSIEDEPNFVRELRAHVVPSGAYSFLWAKSSDSGAKPNDLQLWANRDIVLQAGRSNVPADNNSRVIIQGSAGTTFTQWGASGSNNSRTTIDYVGGARLYQYTAAGSLVNLFSAGGFGYYTGGRFGFGTTSDDGINRVQVAGTVAATSLKLTGLAEPAANSGNEGLMVYTKGTTGVSGSLRICAQLTDGSYAWVPLF